MRFQGRALYNLLRFNAMDEKSSHHYAAWQIEDYKALSDDELLRRLKKLHIPLDLGTFLVHAQNFESPETLTEYLVPDESDVQEADQVYLCIFELWRRLRKDCRSLSIFCYELDEWMHVHDGNREDVDDIIQTYLLELQNFLDEQTDQGSNPIELFQEIASYFAHDVENFIYDFIFELI
jgi:hypothetical protein